MKQVLIIFIFLGILLFPTRGAKVAHAEVRSSRADIIRELCPRARKLRTTAEILSAVDEAASRYRMDDDLVLSMIVAESRCYHRAKSRSGAMGLMQLMPKTARWLGVRRPYSIRDNVLGGTKYISHLLQKFDGNIKLAVAAYNAGPRTVRKYDRIPPYPETRSYVKKVFQFYRKFSSV